ncbi:MAG TPA: ankyrin repeat domain-containing protein [Edaphobacter sp.]|nr:ankyrin repeat domain-containing protein [Edaphobacter sp.]
MDFKKLPSRPDPDHYKKQAKEVLKGYKSGDLAVLQRIRQHLPRLQKATETELRSSRFVLADAQFVLAREHGFESWPRFAKHLEALNRVGSPVSKFESAVDAVVAGDADLLERLLRENPDLVQARSARSHRSTLLLYVGANGVEGYRQKTPKNAVKIAEILLKAGADIQAVGEMYRGTTTLGLVATSIHPLIAGVQNELIDLLLANGASFDGAVAPDYTGGSIVNACLANGRGLAAVYLAKRGARLDLEGATGVGRIDVVNSFFDADGRLRGNATQEQMRSGLNWACLYGRTEIVALLLQKGIAVNERHRGETALNHAAVGAWVEIVRLLLENGASIDIEDERWGGTPLSWAVHGWFHPSPEPTGDYYKTVSVLVAAGSNVRQEWLASDKVRADSRMLTALQGG